MIKNEKLLYIKSDQAVNSTEKTAKKTCWASKSQILTETDTASTEKAIQNNNTKQTKNNKEKFVISNCSRIRRLHVSNPLETLRMQIT